MTRGAKRRSLLPLKVKKQKPRAVVDTNVVVAGIAGFREQYSPGRVPCADLLHQWADREHFLWLYSEDTLTEYKEVLNRLRVRSATIGAFINLIRERGELVEVRASRDISPDPKERSILLSCRARTRRHRADAQSQGLSAKPAQGQGDQPRSQTRPPRTVRSRLYGDLIRASFQPIPPATI